MRSKSASAMPRPVSLTRMFKRPDAHSMRHAISPEANFNALAISCSSFESPTPHRQPAHQERRLQPPTPTDCLWPLHVCQSC